MVKKIRGGVFETNSSSTHTLVVPKKLTDEHKDIKAYISPMDVKENAVILNPKDIEQKLSYLYTAILDRAVYGPDEEMNAMQEKLLSKLKELFPDVRFERVENRGDYYIEDIGWLFEECEGLLDNDDFIKNLVLEGVITVYNRDSWDYVTLRPTEDVQHCIEYADEMEKHMKDKTGEEPVKCSWTG